MPLLNTFSNISKRGFGGFLPLSTNGAWVAMFTDTAKNSYGVATSADGGRITAARTDGVLISADFGNTYNIVSIPNSSLKAAEISYNGQYQLLGNASNGFYKSSNFGSSWTQVNPVSGQVYQMIGMADNGEHQVVFSWDPISYFMRCFKSSNFGSTFSVTQTFDDFNFKPGADIELGLSIATTESGEYQICPGRDKPLFSSNYGATWAKITTLPSDAVGNFNGVAMSSNGQYQIVGLGVEFISGLGRPGPLYLSSDFGATWNEITALGKRPWGKFAMSADGAVQIATSNFTAGIFMSSDFGQNWEYMLFPEIGVPSPYLMSYWNPAISADGRCRYAFGYSDRGFTFAQKNII